MIAGGAPTFSDVNTPTHTYPGAVIGGAPKAKAAPMGDIYFGFEFSTQFAYFLTERRRDRHHLELVRRRQRRQRRVRRGQPGGGPLEPGLRRAHDGRPLDRQRSPGLRHGHRRAPFNGIAVGRLHPVRRHRLGFDQEGLPDPGQRRHPVVQPRTRPRPAPAASTSSATAPSRPVTRPSTRSSTDRWPGGRGAARAARPRWSWVRPRSSTRPRRRSGRSPTASP